MFDWPVLDEYFFNYTHDHYRLIEAREYPPQDIPGFLTIWNL